MSKAIIKENKAYCPGCEKHDYRVKGCYQEYEGNDKYCRVEAVCNGCYTQFNYKYSCRNMKDRRY